MKCGRPDGAIRSASTLKLRFSFQILRFPMASNSQLNTLNATLKAAGIAYRKGRGGVFVARSEHGFVLHSISTKDKPRRFTNKEVQAIRNAFPKYEAALKVLARNQESSGRAEVAKEHIKNNDHVFSFDDKVPDMPNSANIDALEPGKIPKAYAGIQRLEKGGAVLNIVVSEKGVPDLEDPTKRVHPDAFRMQFDLDDGQIRRLNDGEISLKQLIAETKFSSARVMYFDDNAPITGKRARDHHKKSIKTLHATTAWVLNHLNIQIDGVVDFHASDRWRDPASVAIEDGNAEVRRDQTLQKNRSSKASRNQAFSIWQAVYVNRVRGDSRISFQTLDNLADDFTDAIKRVSGLKKVFETSLSRMRRALTKLH